MRSLTPLTIFLRSASTLSPQFLSSSHMFIFYSTSTDKFQRKQREGKGSSHSRNNDLSRNVKISVWWDIENCQVPIKVNAIKAAQNITYALRANGIKGPVTITAFGDVIQLSKLTQENLSVTGVSLNHVPSGGKNTADRALLADLVFWVSQNPPPAHLFLISGDKDFANILHRLRMSNYNILLATTDAVPGVLCSAASIMWRWSQLVRGEGFGGKHFNGPPDGPLESWYIHNRKPLEDPIPDVEQPIHVNFDAPLDAATLCKIRKVPSDTVNQIRLLVNTYPDGVNVLVLRSELLRSNVPLDKDLLGVEKFSFLLKSLHTFLKVKSTVNGKIIVHSIRQKAEPVGQLNVAQPIGQQKISEPVNNVKVSLVRDQPNVSESVEFKLRECSDMETNSTGMSRIATEESNGKTADLNENSLLSTYSTSKIDPPPVAPVENNLHLTEGHHTLMEQCYSTSDVGFFQSFWAKVFSHNGDDHKKNIASPEPCSTSADSFEKSKSAKKEVPSQVSSLNINEPVLEVTTAVDSEEKDKSRPNVGMLSKIFKWYSSWRTSTDADNERGNIGGKVNQTNLETSNNELFSEPDFWEGVLSFLHTPNGVALLSHSKTRRQMAQLLQNEGPPSLATLDISDLNHLVDSIISEKNWVEESISKVYPFKLIHCAQTPSFPSNPHISNELTSVFLDKSPPDCPKSNSKMRVDCQNLVAELFKENPEGFYMSDFKRLFYQRYGYVMENEKLGYPKLAALLQSIPGVVTTSYFAVPSQDLSKTVIPYNSTEKDNNCDSAWKLVEPILPSMSKTKCSSPGVKKDANGVCFDDDSYLSEDVSDSDGESPIKDMSDGKIMGSSSSEEGSPLIQMLDAYYGDKGSNNNNSKFSSEIGRKWSQKNLSHVSLSVEEKGEISVG